MHDRDLNKILQSIPLKYQYTILEYARMINRKVKNGELSDIEYLGKIPCMTDSIIKESLKDRDDYSENFDW